MYKQMNVNNSPIYGMNSKNILNIGTRNKRPALIMPL